eukprot:1149237-Pelagomonas_calceolata.AAC.2
MAVALSLVEARPGSLSSESLASLPVREPCLNASRQIQLVQSFLFGQTLASLLVAEAFIAFISQYCTTPSPLTCADHDSNLLTMCTESQGCMRGQTYCSCQHRSCPPKSRLSLAPAQHFEQHCKTLKLLFGEPALGLRVIDMHEQQSKLPNKEQRKQDPCM